jgi:RimJ/RimL family protein N-acetyltransferase
MTHLSFPQLSGKSVNLRELSMDDATTIVILMSYEISKYLYEVPHPYKIDDALNFIKSSYKNFSLRNGITFGIEYKNTLETNWPLVGTIGIKDIDYVNKKANVGYWIGKQYQDKGIATESVKLVINYAFDVLKLEEISAYVFHDNNPSIRVLEKNGFVKITDEVKEYNHISNSYRNSLIYIIKNKSNKFH